MGHIELTTEIAAARERCFDLARDIDLHQRSMGFSKEVAIDGVTTGMIGPGEHVTWKARHFGIRWRMTSRISAFDQPTMFVDESTDGPFARFRHEHRFDGTSSVTTMRDVVDFTLPFGVLGHLADVLVATPYLRRLLRIRNEQLRKVAQDSAS